MTILRSIRYDYKTRKITATLCEYGRRNFDVVKTDKGYSVFNIEFNEDVNSNDYYVLQKFIDEVEYYEEER